MRHTSFADQRCSLARSLDLIGEWWTLLIVREAFFGTRRFGEFQAQLGIAPNVLTQRLHKLVDGGVLAVTQTSQNGKALEYRLTDKGRDLYPVIVALVQWGDRHEAWPDGPPVALQDRASGQPLPRMQPRAADGRVLGPADVQVVAGPGASAADRERLQAVHARRQARSSGTHT